MGSAPQASRHNYIALYEGKRPTAGFVMSVAQANLHLSRPKTQIVMRDKMAGDGFER